MATRAKTSKVKAAVKTAVKKVTAKKAKPANKAPAKPAAKKKAAPARAPAARAAAKPAASLRASGMTVDKYVATKAKAPWKAVMAELRQTVRTACPEATETIKWGQVVFECGGPFAWMKAFNNYVGFGFWRGAELEDPDRILHGTGNRMRHIKLDDPDTLPIAKIDALVRQSVDLNRRKGSPTLRANR